MYEFLYKYLIVHNSLGIPGIGNFNMDYAPAKINFVNQVLEAPEKTVQFKNEYAGVDKQFLQYLSKELHLNEVEAAKKFTDYSRELSETVINGGAQLPGLGILKKSYSGEISFYPDVPVNHLFKGIDLNTPEISDTNLVDLYGVVDTEIITQKVTIPENQKLHRHEEGDDYWWLYAVVLALMGIGALMYYYI